MNGQCAPSSWRRCPNGFGDGVIISPSLIGLVAIALQALALEAPKAAVGVRTAAASGARPKLIFFYLGEDTTTCLGRDLQMFHIRGVVELPNTRFLVDTIPCGERCLLVFVYELRPAVELDSVDMPSRSSFRSAVGTHDLADYFPCCSIGNAQNPINNEIAQDVVELSAAGVAQRRIVCFMVIHYGANVSLRLAC